MLVALSHPCSKHHKVGALLQPCSAPSTHTLRYTLNVPALPTLTLSDRPPHAQHLQIRLPP